MATPDIERRAAGGLEVRTSGRRLEGYAATFHTEAKLGRVRETIATGAFSRSLSANSDILALLDHNAEKVLGRTRSGSLRLSEDSKGLHFSLDLPDTQAGRDVQALAERGDLGGMSFGFTVDRDEWNGERRTLMAVNLKEISVVSAWPAYPETSVAIRSLESRLVERERRARAIRLAEVTTWA